MKTEAEYKKLEKKITKNQQHIGRLQDSLREYESLSHTREAEVELHFQFIVDNDLEVLFNKWISDKE